MIIFIGLGSFRRNKGSSTKLEQTTPDPLMILLQLWIARSKIVVRAEQFHEQKLGGVALVLH